jgi:S-layer protein (TIGR01567 family)
MAARMSPIISAIALILIALCFFGSTNGFEIRSEFVPVKDESYHFTAKGGEMGSSAIPFLGFPGFYYDIDDDLGREEIIINVSDGKIDGKRGHEGLIYRTSKESRSFKFRDWGQYFTIAFMGQNYFAGYNGTYSNGRVPYLYHASHHNDVLSNQMLLSILIDDETDRNFSKGRPLQLEEGYELVLDEIDLGGERAYLRLLKDGIEIYKDTISCDSNHDEDRIFKYTKDFFNIEDLVILAVHFDGLFADQDQKIAQINGIFQLSENPITIDVGSDYGGLTASSTNSGIIEMKNRNKTISLDKGTNSQIIDRIWLRTADPEEDGNKTRNMYIYLNITEPGTYDVRGPIYEVLKEKYYTCNYANFSGLMYDLDSNIGTEQFILRSNISANGGARLRNLTYRTMARDRRIKMDNWGSYNFIGFMGEKYFAGYAINESNLSLNFISGDDETNLLRHEKLSKVLLDSDEELQPYAAGTSIPLQEGYILEIKEIDSEKIVLDLKKNGRSLDANQILNLESNEDGTYAYHAPILGEKKLVTLAIHFNNTFNGRENSLATIDGIWQISDNLTSIEYGSSSGIMKISKMETTQRSMRVRMEGENNTIRASKGKNESIMGDYFIHFADQDDQRPLRFFIMKRLTLEQSAMP